MNLNYHDYNKNLNINVLNDLKNKYEQYDYQYYKTYDRSKYKLIKCRSRTVKTEYGIVTYMRRIYKNLLTGENECPTDIWVGINKYKRVLNYVKNFIINQLSSGKRYRDIKDMIPNCSISLVTISRILKNAILIEKKIEKVIVKDKLYINMDDCFIDLWNNKKVEKYCCRIFSFATGIKNIFLSKKALTDKRVAFLLFKPSDKIDQVEVYNFIKSKINEFYEVNFMEFFNHNYQIIIGGDGALWIKAMKNWFGGKYVLDKFHGVHYLWSLFVKVRGKKKDSTDWTKYYNGKDLFNNGNYNNLLTFLDDNKVDKNVFNYFKNNEEGIINQNADWNIGVSAESTVFHLVKSLKGNGAKMYHYNTFNNMVSARAMEINSRI